MDGDQIVKNEGLTPDSVVMVFISRHTFEALREAK